MAVAGTVAPIFKGEYNPTVIYNFYNVVNHNNKMWICKVDGTVGIEPNESNADYWYLAIDGADAASLGGETAEEWQNKLDTIQTTSSGTLSQAGWYRVAEYNLGGIANGGSTNGVDLFIKRNYANKGNEFHALRLQSVYAAQSFVSLGSKCYYMQLFTKIRYAHDSVKGYIEVYYNADVSNPCLFEITHGKDVECTWQAITPVLTSETVDGVTITCTYDIPSNASPVTSVDDTNLMGWIELTEGFDLNNALGKYRTPYMQIIASLINCPVDSGEIAVEFIPFNDNKDYGMQMLEQTMGGVTPYIYIRSKSSISWSEWKQIATTADLANYLPKSGGTIIGDTSSPLQLQSSDSSMAWLGFKNNNGVDMGAIGYNGENNPYVYLPNAGGKALIHAGNINNYALPLDGSKAMTGNLSISNTNGSMALMTSTSGIGLIDKSITKWILRKFGGKYYVNDKDEILTKGNSVAVAVTASAPSDTSALWYDTVNKMLKRYVDGAWQQ